MTPIAREDEQPAGGGRKRRDSPQPHARFEHVFVVTRIAKGALSHGCCPLQQDDVMLTKAFFSQAEAENEAARLTSINEEFWHYFVCVARLVDKPRD